MLFGSPPGWAALITCSVLAFGGILTTGYKNEKANTIQILPLTRYGRPWIGGLEGYQITDFWYNLKNDFTAWTRDEIYPPGPFLAAHNIFSRARGRAEAASFPGRIPGPVSRQAPRPGSPARSSAVPDLLYMSPYVVLSCRHPLCHPAGAPVPQAVQRYGRRSEHRVLHGVSGSQPHVFRIRVR